MHYTVTTELNSYTIEKFRHTGHPRTVGILLGALPNPAGLFADVEIEQITLNGEPIELQCARSRPQTRMQTTSHAGPVRPCLSTGGNGQLT